MKYDDEIEERYKLIHKTIEDIRGKIKSTVMTAVVVTFFGTIVLGPSVYGLFKKPMISVIAFSIVLYIFYRIIKEQSQNLQNDVESDIALIVTSHEEIRRKVKNNKSS